MHPNNLSFFIKTLIYVEDRTKKNVVLDRKAKDQWKKGESFKEGEELKHYLTMQPSFQEALSWFTLNSWIALKQLFISVSIIFSVCAASKNNVVVS